MRAEEEAMRNRLVEERKQIERALEAEERELAERRGSLAREEFARLAEAFDTKVRAARKAQEEKALAVQRSMEQKRQRFLDSLRPVIVEVMQRFGASVVLDGRAVLLADPSLDLTGEVIARMDEIYRENNPESGDQ
ncbi:MAG: OmpH family outer membrane protein [Alphaproteobacteria bacterium]|nr:MAG: OmpH family outer membrane protein [Alphaproteobacteria bacterium]